MAVTINKQKIIDSWSVLIANGKGQSEKFYRSVEQYLKDANMPEVNIERTQVVTSRVFGGKGREHIVVNHKYLREFTMFISARDYGSYLDVSWSLMFNNPGRFVSKMITGSGGTFLNFRLNYFDQQEVAAYTTITLNAVKHTAKAMYEELGQDFSTVNTRSKTGLAAW